MIAKIRHLLFLALFTVVFCTVTLPLAARDSKDAPWQPLIEAETNALATAFVVRHAEKEESDRQPLIAKGHARAAALAELLASSGISEVWSTRTERTEDTARPTAESFGLTLENYDGVEEIVEHLHGLDDGRSVLIVGHSNTVPEILDRLGVDEGIHIEHQEYDRFFVVTLTPDGPVFQRFRFAPGSPPRLVAEP